MPSAELTLSKPARALIGILQAQAKVFEELAQLASDQKIALARMESDRLDAFTVRAETLETRFRLLEEERQRLEAEPGEGGSAVEEARATAGGALRALLREGAVAGTVLTRLADTVAARKAAVASLFGSTYLANGRQAGWRIQGSSLSVEG